MLIGRGWRPAGEEPPCQIRGDEEQIERQSASSISLADANLLVQPAWNAVQGPRAAAPVALVKSQSTAKNNGWWTR
jgi:hypothetical protein